MSITPPRIPTRDVSPILRVLAASPEPVTIATLARATKRRSRRVQHTLNHLQRLGFITAATRIGIATRPHTQITLTQDGLDVLTGDNGTGTIGTDCAPRSANTAPRAKTLGRPGIIAPMIRNYLGNNALFTVQSEQQPSRKRCSAVCAANINTALTPTPPLTERQVEKVAGRFFQIFKKGDDDAWDVRYNPNR